MKILPIALVLCGPLAHLAMTPLPQPPMLDPYATRAVLLSSEEVLCASSNQSAIFLMKREGTRESWYRVADIERSTSCLEMDAIRDASGITAACLLMGPQASILALARIQGDAPASLAPIKTFPKGLYPRNLRLIQVQNGLAALYVLSKSDHRDTVLKNPWDRLFLLLLQDGRPALDREIGDEEVVGANSFAAFAGQDGSVSIVRQRSRLGEILVYVTRVGPDGKASDGRGILSLRPAGARAGATLGLDVRSDGSEVQALMAEGPSTFFYRVSPDGTLLQRYTFERPFSLLGYDSEGSRLLAVESDSPALHWLTLQGEKACDEAFEYPGRALRIRQPAGPCRFWLGTETGPAVLRKYCQKGC